jgi:hypothetical protein
MANLVNDELKVLNIPGRSGMKPLTRDDVVRILFDMRSEIEATFTQNEYLKMDLTHGEIIGLKSTAEYGDLKIGDIPALDYIIRNDNKYRKSDIINLKNVNELYKEI